MIRLFMIIIIFMLLIIACAQGIYIFCVRMKYKNKHDIQDIPVNDTIIKTEPKILLGQLPENQIVNRLKVYDYHKLNDPLEPPRTRPDRYLIGPLDERRRLFNYPIRGIPDNPRWLGLLISDDPADHSDNRLIKFFGRQKYPNSNNYEYYVLINNGNDQIKINLDRTKELYNDDVVKIPELGKSYAVKLNKDEDSYYNPYY